MVGSFSCNDGSHFQAVNGYRRGIFLFKRYIYGIFGNVRIFYTETGTRYRIFYTYADLILGLRKGIGTGTKIHLFYVCNSGNICMQR